MYLVLDPSFPRQCMHRGRSVLQIGNHIFSIIFTDVTWLSQPGTLHYGRRFEPSLPRCLSSSVQFVGRKSAVVGSNPSYSTRVYKHVIVQ